MEAAAAAIAFAQAIGMINTGVKALHSIRQAPVEFMDLLNQLSTLNGRAELLRRSLNSLAGGNSDVPDVDINTIRNLQEQFEEISRQLNNAAANFIAGSKGRVDAQGRYRIPRIIWLRQQSNLAGLRQRVKQLSSEITECLAAINTSQGVRQTGLVLDVRAVTEQSFMDVSSQIQRGHTLTERNHEAIHHIVEQNETQTALLYATLANHQETSATIDKRLDVFETRVETQLSQVMARLSPDQNSHRAIQNSQTKAQFDQTVISVSTTLRQTCPPNCRCQCHRTSYARTPEWLSSVMGSLFVQYKGLPILGINKCDAPLCKSASESSIQLQWCFPRWLVARAVVASISWSSINDDGAALFLKIPRSISGFTDWSSISQDFFIRRFMAGTIRATDILVETGENFLTMCLCRGFGRQVQTLLDLGFDPRMKDLTGRCAIHWARELRLNGLYSGAPEVQVTLRELAAMELEDAAPLTMIHQAIRGETTHSLDECIQMEPHHINTLDDVGFAPLHWAVWNEDMTAFQTLMRASANVNQQASHKRETPLHFACDKHNVEMVRELLVSGASISSVDSDKWTPLHYAIGTIYGRQEEMDVVQLLLDAHADINCRNSQGCTPLHRLHHNTTVSSNHVAALAKALIDAGADLEAKSVFGCTTLLHCCRFSCKNALSMINFGANVKAVDGDGQNLFSRLISNKTHLEPRLFHPELLLGVNPDARNKDNDTPLDFMAKEVSQSIAWNTLTRRVVVDMVNLILETREVNWKAGLFLDKKQELETDGSHARMRRWVMRQGQLIQRRGWWWGDMRCWEDDLLGWYQDEYNENSLSETDYDEYYLSDGIDSRDWESISEDDDDEEEDEEEEQDGDDDDNDGDDERNRSDGDDSITFHDAHESLK